MSDCICNAMPAAIYTNSYDANLNIRNGFPVFSTSMEAHWISRNEDQYSAFKLTDEDRTEIHMLARDPNIGESLWLCSCNRQGRQEQVALEVSLHMPAVARCRLAAM